jgi:hypothetical protein
VLGLVWRKTYPGREDPTVDLKIPVDLVLVPITVENPDGKPIRSLATALWLVVVEEEHSLTVTNADQRRCRASLATAL